MKRVNLKDIEKYDEKKFLRSDVVKGDRSQVLLLCLTPGQSVPAHRHEGYEILLHVLDGVVEVTLDGEQMTLQSGDIILVDGANDFAPVNRGEGNFSMLITLVQK